MPVITSQEAIGYLIAANGNAGLAAVRASKAANEQITEAQLLTIISEDPESHSKLANQIKIFTMLHALDAFKKTHMVYLEQLPSLSPKDAAKAYTDLLSNVNTMSAVAAPSKPPENVYEALMRILPADVMDAVKYFMENPNAGRPNPQQEADANSSLKLPDPENQTSPGGRVPDGDQGEQGEQGAQE